MKRTQLLNTNIAANLTAESAVRPAFPPNRYSQNVSGVRSFIITFDVYVILNIYDKYDNKRPDPLCQ